MELDVKLCSLTHPSNHRPTLILDDVPTVHVVSNHIDTDKFTNANGGTFTSSSVISLSTANHVKARQSLIERAVTCLAIRVQFVALRSCYYTHCE